MAAGGSGGSSGEIAFLEALTRSESKRDGGFKNNWSFDHGEESEGDTDKDEANLLSIDEDEDSDTSEGKKLIRQSEIVATGSGDSWKIYARRNKSDNFKPLKGNPIGLNMLSNKKKLSENTQNSSLRSGTVIDGRCFHHANAQIPVVKTAAQSNLDQKERKEYPPHVQKFENNPVRLSWPQGVDPIMKKTEESESYLESEIKRKVSQKRHNSYLSATPVSPASKKSSTDLEFGNSIINTPLKRRKVIAQETLVDPVSLNCPTSYGSVILNCRSIRVGTLFRLLVEPVIFCLDIIKIPIEEAEADPVGFSLNTSDLTKCEWCNVRKLPVVFLQTTPPVYEKLSMLMQMSMNENLWTHCKRMHKLTNLEEQYIILIFQNALDAQASMVFESIVTEIALKNNVSNFFAKIPFEEANSRLVACTRTYEERIKGSCVQKENKIKNVPMESRVQLRSKQFQFFDDDDDETGESHTIFMGPVEKLIVYPPPPAKGGISVTNEDLHCLSEGEFLNDVIIDFYLKYLVLEKLKREDADRIHIFSSFFYKRLNQRERRNPNETTHLSIQQRRHARVKTWTRHVDIFEKDFIFVPLNEAAHWFLAVVCFPGLDKPKFEPNPHYHENTAMQTCSTVEDNCIPTPSTSEMDSSSQNSSAKPIFKKMLNKKHCTAVNDSSAEQEESDPHYRRNIGSLQNINHTASENEESNNGESARQSIVDRINSENGLQNEYLSSVHHTDGLSKIRLNYSDESAEAGRLLEDELIDFSEDQDNQDDSSDDGFLTDDNCNSEIGQWHLKPTICKQPCILLMDSLRGPSRSNVVKILREYLEVEWEVKKGTKRSFSKDVMKGSNPKVPQQNNFSDCGVYVLQYVESFFENPLINFELPMNLANWFSPPRMRTKREEIKNIILKLQENQSKEKKKYQDPYSTDTSLDEGTEQSIDSISD
ncbi:sentrin-specific protease 6 isoform X11 [Pipistrellus kuhlii]|uniref:sentrin-specific protease 6 isoform X11 n=1 Tax=Pipistrellus kuhlii TaxID=59472 RepID=UPI00174EE984|nr:sentrin-specific protease 6 isoform X11 [Pipistrellus kuhlii]